MVEPRRLNPWRIAVWGTAALILLAAAIANQTVEGFNWSAGDFAGAGLILASACLGWELAARTSLAPHYLAGAALAIAGGLALVWINLSVGIIGSEDNRANLVFFGVIGIGGVLALTGHLRPAPVARALTAMALLQATFATGILLAGMAAEAAFSLVIAAIWLGSARLFRSAAQLAAKWTT